jgi:REP element-mobilizing transposase RayT
MSIKREQIEKHRIYYCTFTCYKWLNFFEITRLYDHIYSWFEYMRKEYGNQILSYVIMPNHLHVMIFVNENSKSINQLIGNGKRFMAYEIVKRLMADKNKSLLSLLKDGVDLNEAMKGKHHQVFEPSFDCKMCLNEKFIWQKIKYMHHNPVKGKWNLAESIIDYPHSSAKFYETGVHSTYKVTAYNEAGVYED